MGTHLMAVLDDGLHPDTVFCTDGGHVHIGAAERCMTYPIVTPPFDPCSSSVLSFTCCSRVNVPIVWRLT